MSLSRPLADIQSQLRRRLYGTSVPTLITHSTLLYYYRSFTGTTDVGTAFEDLTMQTLAPLRFVLRRSGGAHDKGIDLVGSWRLPSVGGGVAVPPPTVYVQCKCVAAAVGPEYVRSFMGAVTAVRARAIDRERSGVFLAAFASNSGYSIAAHR
jgi:hypothetical protein